MGYASYLEDINERLGELNRITELTKQAPTSGHDLAVSVENRLREIYKQLEILIGAFQQRLDEPGFSATVSAKSVSEALFAALRQSKDLGETNNALRRQVNSAREHAATCEHTLRETRQQIDALDCSRARIRKDNREARSVIGRLQKTISDLEARHQATLQKVGREKSFLEGRIRDLESLNEELQQQQFLTAVADVRPISHY